MSSLNDRSHSNIRTFEGIKDKIDRPTFYALTQSPFQFKPPSPVQTAVFEHLQDIAKTFDSDPDITRPARKSQNRHPRFASTGPKISEILTIASRSQREESLKSAGTLIISPTRELAAQIATEALKLCEHTPFEVQRLGCLLEGQIGISSSARSFVGVVISSSPLLVGCSICCLRKKRLKNLPRISSSCVLYSST
jgi:hypothetical protein